MSPARIPSDVAFTPAVNSTLDMFYLATASAAGQPYVQYRGGPPGFLRPIDRRTLAFPNFTGNRQYISAGNLSENPRAFLFLMDYVNRRRGKVSGRARFVEGDTELEGALADPDYRAPIEGAIVFDIEAWDVNCPKHIHRRLPESTVASTIERLERELAELRGRRDP